MHKHIYTTETFIDKARALYGDTYDYSNVDYRGSILKVQIRCPIHGSFMKSPNNHISGKQGCPKCSKNSRRHKHTLVLARVYKDKASYDGCTFPIRKIYHNKRQYIFATRALERVLWHNGAHVSPQAKILCSKIYGYVETLQLLKHSDVQYFIDFIK